MIKKAILVVFILALPSAMLFFFSQLRSAGTDGTISEVVSPAGDQSGQPNLWSADGRLYLSWLQRDSDKGHRFLFSRLEKGKWTAPQTIAKGEGWFVNWADFPSITAVDANLLAAHWLVRSGSRTYDYRIQVALSSDGGSSWSAPLVPHRDGGLGEHGFVSLIPWNGRVAAFWLDGRKTALGGGHGSGAMTLRFASIGPAGELDLETELDSSVCDCCQTSAALTSEGPVVAYRDRSEEEIRDISVIRWEGGRWTEPQPVHEDGWQIGGCPVNGPALGARDRNVAVAWYTQADDQPRVNLSFSSDAGRTFSPPVRVDDGETLGRVDLEMLADGSVAVSWMEFAGEDDVEIRLRRVHPDGRTSLPVVVTRTGASRSSGFPRLGRVGDDLLVAWTATGEKSRVSTSIVTGNLE